MGKYIERLKKLSDFLKKSVVRHGFRDAEEFIQLVTSVDISTPEKRNAFNKWQEEDGTKEGFLKLQQQLLIC